MFVGLWKQFTCQINLEALADRPALFLLPWYMAGLIGGWHLRFWPASVFLAAAVLGTAVGCFGLWRGRSWATALWLVSALALGWGVMVKTMTPPEEPWHISNLARATEGRPLVLGGRVSGESGQLEHRFRLFLEVEEALRPGPEGPLSHEPARGLVRLTVDGHLDVQPGDRVRLPATLWPVAGFRNPGLPDFAEYWHGRGVWATGFVKSPRLVTSWPREARRTFLGRLKGSAEKLIDQAAPGPATAGLLKAQLLGLRSAVDPETEQVYRFLGLSHILSVSGLHLSLWFAVCFWGARRFWRALTPLWPRLRPGPAATLTALLPTLFYAALAGSASPVVRSALMVLLAGAGLALRRRVDPWNVLAAVALAILLAAPARLMTVSFQLSFVATLAMVAAFTPRPGQVEGRPGFWRSSLRAAMAGALGAAPLVVWHFGYFPVMGFLANVVLTPLLSFLTLPLGLLSVALAPLWPGLARGLLFIPAQGLELLGEPMARLAEFSGPGFLLSAPGPAFIAAFYLALWLFFRSPRTGLVRTALAGLALLIGLGLSAGLSALLHPQTGVLRLTVLDIGQANAAHVSLPDGRQLLVDGGGSYNFDPAPGLLVPYLSHQGLRRLDIAALTHPDLDHLRGLVGAAQNYRPLEVWSPPWPANWSDLYVEFMAATAEAARPDLASLARGRDFGPVRVEFFWPPADFQPPSGPRASRLANELGLVFKITDREGEGLLITGDIGAATEQRLAAQYGRRLAASVLVAPHHGSRQSLTPEFLAAVRPRVVVFSVGRRNAFGLPHPEALARARALPAQIWRTDQDGAFVFEKRY